MPPASISSAHDSAFDVAYSAAKGWVLPARGDYPADFDQVRHTLIGLAALETVEPKTARADWLPYIGLDMPPRGSGTAITVSDKADKTLAAVIIGNSADLQNAQGASGLFVRHPGDNQSYLARAVFTLHGNVADWLETGVMTIEPARLNTITVTPAQGAAFTVARDHPSDRQYKLEGPPPPKGFTVNPVTINLIPQLITGFAFADVQPASQVDFSKAGAPDGPYLRHAEHPYRRRIREGRGLGQSLRPGRSRHAHHAASGSGHDQCARRRMGL